MLLVSSSLAVNDFDKNIFFRAPQVNKDYVAKLVQRVIR